jgi:phytoene desaturase
MVFLGTSPFDAPALYSLMSYIDFKQGVFYPQGGMYKIIEALVLIGKKLGVQYHLNANVTHIKTTNGHASGIQVNGSFVPADIIISNADLHHTETALLGKSHRSYPEGYWQKKTAAPSALLMYLGVKDTLPKLEHHNLYFVKEWDKNFTDIFEHKKWPDPASLYVSMPSKTDDTVAPKGHENVFILVPTAANERITPKQLEAYADRYLDQFAIAANIPDFKKRIVYKKLVGPADFAQQFNSWHGTALGLAHTLRQSAVFRPKITSKKVDNLYYVGGNTLPGIGLPMCLISAELVYKKLTGDNSAGPLKSL